MRGDLHGYAIVWKTSPTAPQAETSSWQNSPSISFPVVIGPPALHADCSLDCPRGQLTSESTTRFPLFEFSDTIWAKQVAKWALKLIWKRLHKVILSTAVAGR